MIWRYEGVPFIVSIRETFVNYPLLSLLFGFFLYTLSRAFWDGKNKVHALTWCGALGNGGFTGRQSFGIGVRNYTFGSMNANLPFFSCYEEMAKRKGILHVILSVTPLSNN